MSGILQHKTDAILWVIIAIAAVWSAIIWWKGLQDKQGLIFRVLLSVIVLAIFLPLVMSSGKSGGPAVIAALLDALCMGIFLVCIWASTIGSYIGELFSGLYDGGKQRVEAKPFFSIYLAKRSRGKYEEALEELRKQLELFPNDFDAQMHLAELQAESLKDLPGASATVQRICAQQHSAQNISFALNRLADWHLGLAKDREAARQALEKIIELLPDTEMSQRASQKIARLEDPAALLAAQDRAPIEIQQSVRNLGLQRGEDGKLRAPVVDQEKAAADYVAQLEKHPLDSLAREKLAVLYAQHYHRLDLAVEQFEQLIQQPNHTAKQVAQWLNLMADMQVQEGGDEETVRATLQRIIDLFPGSGPAETARRRLDRLKLEMKQQTRTADVHIGVYEQNIGLKRTAGGQTKRR